MNSRQLHGGELLSVTKTLFDMIDEHQAQIAETGRSLQTYQREVQDLWRPIHERYVAGGSSSSPGTTTRTRRTSWSSRACP